jgi:hypothetical protein
MFMKAIYINVSEDFGIIFNGYDRDNEFDLFFVCLLQLKAYDI